jgi:hypothetical protein
VVDEHRATAEAAQAELRTGLQDRVVDLLRVRGRALQLVPHLARHALPQRPDPSTGDLDLGGVHELHVAQPAPRRLLAHEQRIGPCTYRLNQSSASDSAS